NLGFAAGLGASGVFVAMMLLGVALFAGFGWPLLRWVGRRYQRKKFSDQSLIVDSVFLLFGIEQSIGLAFEGAGWITTGLVAFAASKMVPPLALQAARGPPRTLLLLRVFRLGKRSERFFDRLRRHWLHAGSIGMIAGPD